MRPIIIKTENFLLRPFVESDEEAIAQGANNPNIYRPTLRIPYPYTREHAREWIKRAQEEWAKENPSSLDFGIEIDGKIAGGIGLANIKEGHEAEIGYWLAEPYWGKGIMTEAATAMEKFGFETLGLVRIYAGVYTWNTASQKVLEKVGFVREGLRRKGVYKNGEFLDDYLYAIVQ
ncbi:MAG: GNAT family N-acetyltransferase [Candidatus Wildermuthbacteria bacterium]|nr:GNAT family N-acetyltransferase [Candidatus Wildermuthbacteria bacterium]